MLWRVTKSSADADQAGGGAFPTSCRAGCQRLRLGPVVDKVLAVYDESQVEMAYEPHPSDGTRRRADRGAYVHRRPGVW